MANRLKLRRVTTNAPINGIGGDTVHCKESINVKLESRYSNFTADVECLIIPRVSGKVPPSSVNATAWPIPKGFHLADPKFHTPDRIDMLVGASWYFRLLKEGHLQMWDNYPDLRETHLGWVVVGGAGDTEATQQLAHTALLAHRKIGQGTTTVTSGPNREAASAGPSPSPGGGCWSFVAQRNLAALVKTV